MKKYLLILYMSLQALLCSAQVSADSNDLPVLDIPGSDTSSAISDLISAVNENTKVVLRWKKSKFAKTDLLLDCVLCCC